MGKGLDKILRVSLELLRKLEWSGEWFFFEDKCTLPECPVCHGPMPLGDEDDVQRGHDEGCELDNLMRSIQSHLGMGA